MANTFDSALITDSVRSVVQKKLATKLAALALFSNDFGVDPLAPKKTVQVPYATAGATAQTNATNFESGDSTLSKISVSVDQLSVSFHVTNAQLQQGYRLEHLLGINLDVLANKIMDVATAPFTTTNFGTAAVVAAAADFGSDDLKVLWAAAKNYDQKHLILSGDYLAQFIPTDKFQFALGEQGAYGFDRIAMNNRWNGAGTNVVGAVCDPKAVAVASGMSEVDAAVANLMLVQDIVLVPGINLPVQFCMWGSTATRNVWGCFDLMFGSGVGDTTAAEVITSA